MDKESFWQGDDLSCWHRGRLGFQYFPTLTISLAASANETIKLVVTPHQYLRLVSDKEQYSGEPLNVDYDCYRVSISASDSGVYFSFVIFLFACHCCLCLIVTLSMLLCQLKTGTHTQNKMLKN